jgi:hypothetical protein
MLRIFGRTTLVSQFMVRSELQQSAIVLGIWGWGETRQAADGGLSPL